MKSGLGDRNNPSGETVTIRIPLVSMKSGLGDRNNFLSALILAVLPLMSQ